FRRYQLTARQAVQRWGDQCSEQVKNAAAKHGEQKFWFVHAVEPNDEFEAGRIGARGKAWTSVYVEVATKRELQRGGFDDFPFMWPRWEVAAGEVYGRGIGEQTLADVL